MAESPAVRLFFALWPDDEVRAKLWTLSRSLGEISHHGGRAVDIDNLHLTLAGLGSVDQEMHRCAEQAAARVEASPFEIILDCVGYWGRPRIQWAGCRQKPVALQRLVDALNRQLHGCGYSPEFREFAPHVTLRRKARPLPHQFAVDPIPWKARSFCLVQSVTRAQGPEYRVLKSWTLGEGSARQ